MIRARINLVVLMALTALAVAVFTLKLASAEASLSQSSSVAQIDAAIQRAVTYLVALQGEDGTWRSATYGAYRDGPTLTAMVTWALIHADPTDSHGRRGLDYLALLADSDEAVTTMLIMPVYTAAMAAEAFIEAGRPHEARPWLKLLLSHQMADERGWHRDDPQYGGWGYSPTNPQRPDDEELARHTGANISATVFALAALRRAEQHHVLAIDPAVFDRAVYFLDRCQNWSGESAREPTEFEDGGFVFTIIDTVRNKAGMAGIDHDGRARYHSYGSTTADGYRARLLAGQPINAEPLVAARDWLLKNFDATSVPGRFNDDREVLRNGYYFYYAWSVSPFLCEIASSGSPNRSIQFGVTTLADELLNRQRSDGSSSNHYTDGREDDPIVATSFTIMSLRTLGECE